MADPLVTVEHLDIWYPRSTEPAVSGVQLVIQPGAAMGIVGESGSGKTTLGRAIVGDIPATHGSVRIYGQPWGAIKRTNPLRRKVQMIFQDPYAALNPMLTAHETVAEVLRVWESRSRAAAAKKALDLLGEVGLSGGVVNCRPRRLSGGQAQRVGIARALAASPSLIVADEPTSSLDVSIQAQILNLFLDLRSQYDVALLIISHDLSVIDYVTDEALVMYRGRVVERSPTRGLLTEPWHPYTRALVDSLPGSDRVPRLTQNDTVLTGGCVYAPRCPHMRDDCLKEQPVDTFKGERAVACIYPLAETEFRSPVEVSLCPRKVR